MWARVIFGFVRDLFSSPLSIDHDWYCKNQMCFVIHVKVIKGNLKHIKNEIEALGRCGNG